MPTCARVAPKPSAGRWGTTWEGRTVASLLPTAPPLRTHAPTPALFNLLVFCLDLLSKDICRQCQCCKPMEGPLALLTQPEQCAVVCSSLVALIRRSPLSRNVLVDAALLRGFDRLRQTALHGCCDDPECEVPSMVHRLMLDAVVELRLPVETLHARCAMLRESGEAPSAAMVNFSVDALLTSIIGATARDFQTSFSTASRAVFDKAVCDAYGPEYFMPPMPELCGADSARVVALVRSLAKGLTAIPTADLVDSDFWSGTGLRCGLGKRLQRIRVIFATKGRPVAEGDEAANPLPVAQEDVTRFWAGLSNDQRLEYIVMSRAQLVATAADVPVWLTFRHYVRVHTHPDFVGGFLNPSMAWRTTVPLPLGPHLTVGSDAGFPVAYSGAVKAFLATAAAPPPWLVGRPGALEAATELLLDSFWQAAGWKSFLAHVGNGLRYLMWRRVAVKAQEAQSELLAATIADLMAAELLMEEEAKATPKRKKNKKKKKPKKPKKAVAAGGAVCQPVPAEAGGCVEACCVEVPAAAVGATSVVNALCEDPGCVAECCVDVGCEEDCCEEGCCDGACCKDDPGLVSLPPAAVVAKPEAPPAAKPSFLARGPTLYSRNRRRRCTVRFVGRPSRTAASPQTAPIQAAPNVPVLPMASPAPPAPCAVHGEKFTPPPATCPHGMPQRAICAIGHEALPKRSNPLDAFPSCTCFPPAMATLTTCETCWTEHIPTRSLFSSVGVVYPTL